MLEFFPDTRDLILERSVKGGLSGQLRKVKSEAWHILVQVVQVVPDTTSHLFRPWFPAPNAEEILPPTSSPSRSILVPRSNCVGIQNK